MTEQKSHQETRVLLECLVNLRLSLLELLQELLREIGVLEHALSNHGETRVVD